MLELSYVQLSTDLSDQDPEVKSGPQLCSMNRVHELEEKCGCHVYHVCGVVFSTFENYLLDRISFVPGTESHHLCCPFPLSRANSTRGRSCKKHLLNYYYRVVILYILLRMQMFKIIVIIIF